MEHSQTPVCMNCKHLQKYAEDICAKLKHPPQNVWDGEDCDAFEEKGDDEK